jgi:hypothetical protein
MRMTGNDDTNPRGAGVDIELREIVDDVDEYVAYPDQLGLTQARRPRLRIIIASDGNQRSHGGEFLENLGPADVAAVDDVIAADEKCARLRPE